MSFKTIFSKKNANLFIGIITLLILLWISIYAIPSLFFDLFNTILGKIILFGLVVLAGLYNTLFGVGLALVFIILFQLSHVRK